MAVTNQEIVFGELGGKCWHKWGEDGLCLECGISLYNRSSSQNCVELLYNPCLTSIAGVFWMLDRFDEWNKYADFTVWMSSRLGSMNNKPHTIMCALRWIALDAKDGKAPALYNALCEFLRLEEAA